MENTKKEKAAAAYPIIITQCIAMIILVAAIISLKYLYPDIYGKIKNFYKEEICYDVMSDYEI